jgi:hypothetical protein
LDPECFEGKEIKTVFTFDDLKLTIEEDAFEFSGYFGLEPYCRAYDDFFIRYCLETIDKYLKKR